MQDVMMYGAVLPSYKSRKKSKEQGGFIYADDVESSDKLLGITR